MGALKRCVVIGAFCVILDLIGPSDRRSFLKLLRNISNMVMGGHEESLKHELSIFAFDFFRRLINSLTYCNVK